MNEDLEKLLRLLEKVNPDVSFMDLENLIDDEIITSLDLVQIISQIEEEFHIQIDEELLTPENFNSVQSMIEMIREAGNEVG